MDHFGLGIFFFQWVSAFNADYGGSVFHTLIYKNESAGGNM